jgi:molybdate transport system regulatory protein
MQPKSNLWIEKDGQVVLSKWRVELLRAIDETGSISAAAEKMQVSYHRAWEKIHEMETRLGLALVETQTGGSHGGGAQLTATARDYIARFDRFSQGIDQIVARRFDEAFGQL